MTEASSSPGIFLNGKAQIIEMLQVMNPDEKDTILKNIRNRNPELASELAEKSLTFNTIKELSDANLTSILPYVNPPVLGIALKGLTPEFQRKILSLAPREEAKKAFQLMTTTIADEPKTIKRAQQKIVETVISLHKRRVIQL